MLILSRRIGESVIIETASGEQIIVTVVGKQGGQARLGFHADESVIIHREEIYKRIQDEKKNA